MKKDIHPERGRTQDTGLDCGQHASVQRTTWNERGGCASKNMTWHEPFRLFFYSYFAAISAAFVFALPSLPLSPLPRFSLAFFFWAASKHIFFHILLRFE